MFKVKGSCHCGNIAIDAAFSNAPNTYNPRACDCDFCCKHGASYLSDSNGELNFNIKQMSMLGRYKQGSDLADFLFCLKCGVLVGVSYQNAGKIFAAVNGAVLDKESGLGEKTSVSPKMLSGDEKAKRWQQVWFSNVSLKEVLK